MSKFERFTDAYCLFFDYGARGWIIFSVITLISLVLTFLDFVPQSWAVVAMFLGMMLMIGFWYWSYSVRKPPEFWIELGKGKNFKQ